MLHQHRDFQAPVVISLFDFTGEAVKPWAEAGYECFCLDIQHEGERTEIFGKGTITFQHWDASQGIGELAEQFQHRTVEAVFSWAPCTDLAGSGARHWAGKRARDPMFQHKAAAMCRLGEQLAERVGARFWLHENPVGALSTLWRKPDYIFQPCDYGGYIPEDQAEHPKWPSHIPPRDAYTKKTCLWVGGDFVMPTPKPVEPVKVAYVKGDGTITRGSTQWGKLGGKSLRTKNIRSATPRGFAQALFLSNTTVTI